MKLLLCDDQELKFNSSAASVSSVINGIGPFDGLGGFLLPGSLANALEDIQRKQIEERNRKNKGIR